jgi:hypothetical protein
MNDTNLSYCKSVIKRRFTKDGIFIILVFLLFLFSSGFLPLASGMDYSGTYTCVIQGDVNSSEYVRIEQSGTSATVFLSWDCPASATVNGGIMTVLFGTAGSMVLTFSENGETYSGTWQYYDMGGTVTGTKVDDGVWLQYSYDIDTKGIPRFVETDFTELNKISGISRFRSGEGHDYSDCLESCRSMKHYYAPFEIFRDSNNIEIYSPVEGIIDNIQNEQSGSSIRIRSSLQPAFIFVIFHTDLISSDIDIGTSVWPGQLLGHASYSPELYCFDIAVWVNTPSGMRYISYFETMTDEVFDRYIMRGAQCRCDFIISRQERDANSLICNGEQFLGSGSIENWVTLGFSSGFDLCGAEFGPPDGVVNIWDLAYLANHWLETNCNISNWCDRTDFDHNTTVDFVDFAIFAENWLWEKIPADLDIDGDVDFVDYAAFANHWMNQNCAEPNWCSGADLNKSGSVDLYDLGKFADNWLEGTAP